MRSEIKSNGVTWININKPDKKDVKFLDNNFYLDDSVLKEFIPPLKRSKVEEYADYLFIVIHFPVFNRKLRKTISTELDIILFKKTIITGHTGLLPELKKIFEDCESDEYLRNYHFKNSAVTLAYFILDYLVDTRLPMLDHIDDNINNIEEGIFNGNEKKMVSEIAVVKRDIINFRRIIKPQRMVFETMAHMTGKITPENLSKLSNEVIGSNIKVWNTLENHKEMVEALEQTNESLISYKLNDTMKILAALSAIMLPLSLIVNTFGMNATNGMPFIKSPFAFWIVFLIMLTMTIISILFFKYKKWL